MAIFAVIGCKGKASISGVQSINIGGSLPQNTLTFGAGEYFADGTPSPPSLFMQYPSYFRFKWIVQTGTRTIQVSCKQDINLTPRPSMIVRANVSLGVPADVSATAPSGTGWVIVGPVTITATTMGLLYVDLLSNGSAENANPCLWDNIVST